MHDTPLKRRAFLSGTAASALALSQTAARAGANGETDTFSYEITRTEAEWRERLTNAEYAILRQGSTELPETSEIWDNTAKGTYCCKGCELIIYDSVWKVPVDKGWAFFAQSRPNTVLMGIDGQPPDGMNTNPEFDALIEAHCRRCGSHLGHILTVEGRTLHCINGTALSFEPASA